MHRDDRRILEIFNEKVDKLERSSFARFLKENQLGYTFQRNSDGSFMFTLSGPSEEATDAFSLTLRMFLQNNDVLSFANLDALYQRLPVTEHLRLQFTESRKRLNEHLDGPSIVVMKGDRLSNRYILKTFLYGLLAHTDLTARHTIDAWAEDPIRFQILQMVFFGVLIDIVEFAIWVRTHNQLALTSMDV
jgi:hypothetical protein